MESSITTRTATQTPNHKEAHVFRAHQCDSDSAGLGHLQVPPHPLAGLQTTVGNRAVQQILPTILRRKLKVGAPEDIQEKEADTVAEQGTLARTLLPAAGTPGSDDERSNPRGPARKDADRTFAQRNMLRRMPIQTLQQSLGNHALARLFQQTLPVPSPELSRKCACGGASGTKDSDPLPAHELTHTIQQTGGATDDLQRFSLDDVSNVVSGVGQTVQQGVSAVGSAFSSGAQAAALAAANAIAAPFGGHVTAAPSGGIEITIDDIDIAELENETLVLPLGLPTVTLFEKDFKVGDFVIQTWAGTILGDPSVTISIGPVKLQNIKLLLDPLGTTYAGTAQLYVGSAVSGSVEKANEARVLAAGVIPVEPPIPVVASGEVGTRAILRLVGKEGFTDSVSLAYSGGSFVFRNDLDVKLGAIAQLDHEAFLRVEIEGEEICSVIWPIRSKRLGEKGIDINVPLTVAYGSAGKLATIGKPTASPIAPDSIPTDLQDEHEPTKCKSLKDLTEFLCKKGILPSAVCSIVAPTTPAKPVGPKGIVPPKPVTPPVGPVGPIGPSASDDCAKNISYELEFAFFPTGPKTKVKTDGQTNKHTKMAKRDIGNIETIADEDCAKLIKKCEIDFCNAASSADANYGGQVDKNTSGEGRYKGLLTQAFQEYLDKKGRPPKSGEWEIHLNDSDVVGYDIAAGKKKGTTSGYTLHAKTSNNGKDVGAHIFPRR